MWVSSSARDGIRRVISGATPTYLLADRMMAEILSPRIDLPYAVCVFFSRYKTNIRYNLSSSNNPHKIDIAPKIIILLPYFEDLLNSNTL